MNKGTLHCHIDGVSGIAGDMMLAALVDAGADINAVSRAVAALFDPQPVTLYFDRVLKNGISALYLRIDAPQPIEGLRHWSSIRRRLEDASLDDSVKARSIRVLGAIAGVEAAIHGIDVERVHFHEIGALDTLVDVVGSVAALHDLNASSVSSAPINLGGGRIKIDHGAVPVPAPATAALAAGVPTYGEEGAGELATPTGMALLKTLCDSFGAQPPLTVSSIGYGAGTKDRDGVANVVRVILGRAAAKPASDAVPTSDQVVELAANIDDQPPEQLAYVVDHLLAHGALDVWQQPIMMKKNRAGILLSCLVKPVDKDRLTALMLTETTSLGVRAHMWDRSILARQIIDVETPFGTLPVKLGLIAGKVITAAPEFEACKQAAIETGTPLKTVMDGAKAAAHSLIKPD